LREFAAECGRSVIEKPFLPADVRDVVAAITALPPPPSRPRRPHP
jgi:hypothetical protein